MLSIVLRSDLVRHIAASEQHRLAFEEEVNEMIFVFAEYLQDAILNVGEPSAQRDAGRRRQREGEDDHEKSKSRSLPWLDDEMLIELQQLRQQQKKQWFAVQVTFMIANDFASVLHNLIVCATCYLPSREWYRILYLARECAKLLFPSSYVQQSPHPPESSRTFNLGHNISFKGNDEDNNSAFCILNNIELSDSGYEKVCDGAEAKLDRLQDGAGGLLRCSLEPLMRALYCAFDIELVNKKRKKHSRSDDDDDDDDDACSRDVDSETEDEKLLGRDLVQEKIAQILDAILPIHTENYLFKVERPEDEEGSIFENMAHPEGAGKFFDPRVSSQILSLLIDLSVFDAVMREGVVDSWNNAARMKTNSDGDNDRVGTNINTSSSSSASANQQVKQKIGKKLDTRILDSLFGSGLVIRGVKRDSGIVADDHSYGRVVESGFSSAGGASGKFGILAWASKWLEFPDRVCSLDPGVEQRKAELGGSFYALEKERRRRQQDKSLPQRSKANLIRSFMKNLNSLHQDQDQAEIVDDEEKESELESVQENDSRLVCDGDEDDEQNKNMNNEKIHESKIHLLSFELVDAVLQYLLPSEVHSAALACKSWQNVVLNRIPLRRYCQLAQTFTRRINWFLRQEWGETIVLLEHKTC